MENEGNKSPLSNGLLVLFLTSLIAIGLTSMYDLMLMVISVASEEQMAEAMQQSIEQVKQMQLGDPSQIDMTQLYKMIDNSVFHLLFNIVELVGVVMLMMRREIGIHFYVASQIGLAYIAYLSWGDGSMLIILTCVLWSLLYWKGYMEMFGSDSK